MMDTTEGELTADDMAIYYAFANEIAGEEPGLPSADAGGAWTLVGRGGGGSGGGGVEAASAEDTGLDLPYTPMHPTSGSPEDLDTSWRDLPGSTSLDSSSSSSSSSKRGSPGVLKNGTLVNVFEGTAGGIRGKRAVSYLAKVVNYISGLGCDGHYEVKPVVESQKTRRVPAYSVQVQQSFMSPGSQRAKHQMTSQQKRKNIQNDKERTALAAALKAEKKERAKLMRKYHMIMEDNKTMKAERAALLACLGKKGSRAPTRAMEQLIRPIINVARQSLAVEMESLEKESKRLGRHVTHREREVDFLRSKLQLRIAAEERLRDRKNRALKEKRATEAKNMTLKLQRDTAVLKAKELRESVALLKAERDELISKEDERSKSGGVQTRTKDRGRPYTDEFEAHAVSCMATGISARQCREQMLQNAAFHKAGDGFVVPELDWFERIRERLGNESILYAFIKIAGAKEILQHGSDETGIHRQGTYNQWVRLRNSDDEIETIYIETGGILVGATAVEVAAHIEKTWGRGQAMVEALRAELGDEADRLVPIVNGGVNLLKLRSLMHDTCNTANATAREIARLVEEKGREYYGDGGWDDLPEEEKCILDFLCGNHTRGLPVDAFNRRFEGWLAEELSAEFDAAAGESGGRARLEKSGTSLLRSLFKLIHSGWGAYEKVRFQYLLVIVDGPRILLSVPFLT